MTVLYTKYKAENNALWTILCYIWSENVPERFANLKTVIYLFSVFLFLMHLSNFSIFLFNA